MKASREDKKIIQETADNIKAARDKGYDSIGSCKESWIG